MSLIPVLAGSALMLGLAASTGTAHAADWCNTTAVCLYDNTDYTVKLEERSDSISRTDLGVDGAGNSKQDRASAHINNRTKAACVYREKKNVSSSASYTLSAHSQEAWGWGAFPHDRVRSWRTNGGC